MPEERELYLRMAMQRCCSVREVSRQIDCALFYKSALNPPKLSTALREIHPHAEEVFMDAYFVEFMGLPEGLLEADLQKSLINNLRHFLTELVHEFCFIGHVVLPP